MHPPMLMRTGIALTAISFLGLVGILILLGVDFFQYYDASGMLGAYAGCTSMFLGGGVGSAACYIAQRNRTNSLIGSPQYEVL